MSTEHFNIDSLHKFIDDLSIKINDYDALINYLGKPQSTNELDTYFLTPNKEVFKQMYIGFKPNINDKSKYVYLVYISGDFDLTYNDLLKRFTKFNERYYHYDDNYEYFFSKKYSNVEIRLLYKTKDRIKDFKKKVDNLSIIFLDKSR